MLIITNMNISSIKIGPILYVHFNIKKGESMRISTKTSSKTKALYSKFGKKKSLVNINHHFRRYVFTNSPITAATLTLIFRFNVDFRRYCRKLSTVRPSNFIQ